MIRIDIHSDEIDCLGESPRWHAHEQRLYWVDSFAPAICRTVATDRAAVVGITDTASAEATPPFSPTVERFALPDDIGSFVFAQDGSLVAGMRSGFNRIELGEHGAATVTHLLDPFSGGSSGRDIASRDPRLMLNDGRCDRRGRYWCASVHSDFIGRQAELFRLDPDLRLSRIDGGFIIGNGIAFSPDDSRLYLADSRDETVWCYDFDLESGVVSNRRRFFSTAEIEGRVDGACCDHEGNYWCALVHGGAVACISPGGRMIERLEVPARHPTMVAFGGPELDTLFVTSASCLLDAEARHAWPDAGKVFRVSGLGAHGVPEPWFGIRRNHDAKAK